MNSLKKISLAACFSLLSFTALHAQTPSQPRPRAASGERSGQGMPTAFRGFRMPPSSGLRFLASEEGRSYLQAIGHPIAPYAIQVFGQPSKATVVPDAW